MNQHWSRYNFLIELGGNKFLLYNTYTNNLLEISNHNDYVSLLQIKKGNFQGISEDFLDELSENSILVEDDEIIFQKIKLARLTSRFRSDIMHLTLVPTMACNFRCPYCFEENIQERETMKEKTADDIIAFVKSFKNLRYLNIEWFGGEPLLAFDRVMDVTKKLKELSIGEFHASIVTNGYLLDNENIAQLKVLGISTIQITVDGMEETHNQRRPHKSKNDSFQKIIDNIMLLYAIYPEANVHVRVNIDKNNAADFFDLNKYLNDTIQNPHLFVYPAYITEYNPCNATFCMLNRNEQADFAVKNIHKYSFEKFYYPMTKVSECTARLQNSYVIGPKGEFYKCWSDVGMKEKVIGNILDRITNMDLYARYMTDADPLFDTKCVQCPYFPICDGGCVSRRIKNIGKNNSKSKDDLCAIQKNKLYKFLKLYYEKNVSNK